MARIKFGMMMTDARGKLGGQVFSKSKSGAFIATKTIPRNVQSQSQLRRRSDFAQFSNEWNNLSDFQKEAWSEWAIAHPLVNEFGDNYTITGRNYFMRNMAMLKLALDSNYTPVSVPVFKEKSDYRVKQIPISVTAKRIRDFLPSGSRAGYYTVMFFSKKYSSHRSSSSIEFSYVFGDFSLFDSDQRYNLYVAKFGTPKFTDIVYYKLYVITPSGEFFAPQIGQCLII